MRLGKRRGMGDGPDHQYQRLETVKWWENAHSVDLGVIDVVASSESELLHISVMPNLSSPK